MKEHEQSEAKYLLNIKKLRQTTYNLESNLEQDKQHVHNIKLIFADLYKQQTEDSINLE